MEIMDSGNVGPRRSRLARVGNTVAITLREALHQLALIDTTVHEGRLRGSIMPDEYLPQVPDYPPEEGEGS